MLRSFEVSKPELNLFSSSLVWVRFYASYKWTSVCFTPFLNPVGNPPACSRTVVTVCEFCWATGSLPTLPSSAVGKLGCSDPLGTWDFSSPLWRFWKCVRQPSPLPLVPMFFTSCFIPSSNLVINTLKNWTRWLFHVIEHLKLVRN